MPTVSDYVNLLPSATGSQPNFVASVSAALQPFADVQLALAGMLGNYDLDTATGASLDVIGQWVGVSRQLATPVAGTFFSFDTSGLGWDQGVWFGPGDSTTGRTTLDDDTYRLFIRLKIAANNWDGTLGGAQQILNALSTGGTYVFIQDNFNMSMQIGISGVVPSVLFVSIIQQAKAWLKPAGVALDRVAVTSVSGTACFGFDINNSYVSGFDSGNYALNY
jgi:hypothetical protein